MAKQKEPLLQRFKPDTMKHYFLKEAFKLLDDDTILSDKVKSLIDFEKEITAPELENIYDDPLFEIILFDVSGSMEPFKQKILDEQEELLNGLRQSDKCKKGSLLVSQYLFNETTKQVHSFELLSPTKNDLVAVFKNTNGYSPEGMTNLYESVQKVIKDLIEIYVYTTCKIVKLCLFVIALLTNRDDNVNEKIPIELKEIIQELTSNNIIRSSILVGVTDSKNEKENFEKIKDNLGFLTLLLFDGNIRDFRRGLS